MKKIIIVDPGHGGIDNGASYGNIEEDELNLSISYLLQYELIQRGFECFLTRETDEYISLGQRVEIAKAYRTDAFISIHCDAWHKKTAQGMTVHIPAIPSIQDIELATLVSRKLSVAFPMHRSRGIRKSNFTVLTETYRIPSILIECEFMSNLEQLKFLKKPENQRRLVKAITSGTMRFLK